MTLDDVRAIVLACDPEAKHYRSEARGNYTTWQEYERLPYTSDGVNERGWRFQIDRFTKLEDDPVAAQIEDRLSGMDNVAYSYMVDHEPETGFIHHIFDCEAI